jgi:hypothetical protein
MRLQRYFALSLGLFAASLGCSSNSGSAQPQQHSAPVQTATTTTGGSATTTTAAGANSNATTPASPAKVADACALLTSDDIEAVQGEAVQTSKPSQRTDSAFAVAQCFYTTQTFTKSVSVEVMERGTSSQSVHEFWEERMEKSSEESEREREYERGRARKGETEKERERQRQAEREREAEKPRRLKGIGDEAYWITTDANSTMYVFKKDTLLRISIGGTDGEAARLKKIKTLAEKALSRL